MLQTTINDIARATGTKLHTIGEDWILIEDHQFSYAVPADIIEARADEILAADCEDGDAYEILAFIEASVGTNLGNETWLTLPEDGRRAIVEERLLGDALCEFIEASLPERVDGVLAQQAADAEGWWADDGNCKVHFSEAESGHQAAREYVDGGDWGEASKTFWVDVNVWRIDPETGEETDEDRITVTVDPPEPKCDHGHEHDWQAPYSLVGGCVENPGVFGHGGGVVMHRACVHCGCRRTIDTWAQNPSNGEQGLESVEYEEGYYSIDSDED